MTFEQLFSCLCCRKSKNYRFVEEGFERVEGHLNLINYLKAVKIQNTTLKSMTTHESR